MTSPAWLRTTNLADEPAEGRLVPAAAEGDHSHLALGLRRGADHQAAVGQADLVRVGQRVAFEQFAHEGVRIVDELLHGHGG